MRPSPKAEYNFVLSKPSKQTGLALFRGGCTHGSTVLTTKFLLEGNQGRPIHGAYYYMIVLYICVRACPLFLLSLQVWPF